MQGWPDAISLWIWTIPRRLGIANLGECILISSENKAWWLELMSQDNQENILNNKYTCKRKGSTENILGQGVILKGPRCHRKDSTIMLKALVTFERRDEIGERS